MIKRFACAALAAVILVPSAGCFNESGENKPVADPSVPQSSPSEPVTLTLRHTQIKESAKARLRILQDVVSETERQNPGLKFQLEGIDEIINRDQKLKAEMATGTTPDIFEIFGGSDVRLYVKAGRLLDLTPIIRELGIENQFQSLEEFTVDGKVYGLPFGGYSEALYYNKSIFKELGLGIPATWDELMQAADKIKKGGYTPFALSAKDPWIAGMMWNTIMDRYAGTDKLARIAAGTDKWTDPDMVASFRAYSEIVKAGYFPADALSQSDKQQAKDLLYGKAAMLFTGTWDLAALTGDNAGPYKNDLGYFSFPSIPGGAGDLHALNTGYSNGFGFSSTLSQDQIAMVTSFIRSYFNEANQKRILLEDKTLPSMKLSDFSGVDPLISEVLQVVGNAPSTFRAFDYYMPYKINTKVGIGLQELIGQIRSPEAVAAEIQAVQDNVLRDEK
ncbi:ABC transporter substrate-binding protein [Paenibacillus sp. D51F]